MVDLVRAAHWYARHRIGVFPVLPRDKAPACENGCKDATTDANTIARMWHRPDLNVGIVAGPNGFAILDVDGPIGAETRAALERVNGPLPITWTVETASGLHFYFLAPDGVKLRGVAHALGAGLDTRTGWQYCVAPPSVHASGHVYRWRAGCGPHEIALAPLPQWLVELLRERPIERGEAPIYLPPAAGRERSYARAALAAECREVQKETEGKRNGRLNAASYSIGQLVGAGWLDDRLARGALIAAGVGAGLRQLESIKTVNSGLSAGMRKPREKPLEDRQAANG